ncbi:flagellar hook assembly protein FlgD [Pseudomonas sp. MDMC216]|jgi:flagellar basal-body rod modification protein FlgD|uniref:Basal-body rod modification protein FlgD n=1 Tax=Ectopseudomonas chengduensis TaxID=489632 RepID=A0A1G6IS42_9GAMM|nr:MULTISPECIES: flagellar hook assembly protein FlgD [Pseudomonas]KJU75636.1 flagellar basal body rod modification protein [Pseudomonas oleovorans]ERH52630.1 flagellar basal body rod modification protein FlgD [Pseudomonas chengduensis]KQO33488.1 flagellar basal body rod modification protein [Pseudomonas sp. Leaf83]MBP3059947.1 flagellar hook assembly protein FlgD [Pseudomonas chengduensis]MDH0956528.1 flagellar hook assembly protein FlgD [Pseudomonas chengduensis]
MTTVSNNSQNNPAYSIDEAVKQSVNVSDATQLENNFLTLMVAQIQNQDPTKPVDSTEFLNQFAAMSQVKSLENMASLSKSNLVLLDNLQTLTAAGLVGQEVKVATEQLELGADKVKGEINLEHAAGKLALVVTDSNGVKKEIDLGSQAPGRVPFELDPKALGLAPGSYKVEVKSDSGEYPKVEVAGRVTQVRVSAEGPVLEVIGVGSVPFYNITEFGQTQTAGLL